MNIYLFFYKGNYVSPNIKPMFGSWMLVTIDKQSPGIPLSDDEIRLKIKLTYLSQLFVDDWINRPINMGFKIYCISWKPVRLRDELGFKYWSKMLLVRYGVDPDHSIDVDFGAYPENIVDNGLRLFKVLEYRKEFGDAFAVELKKKYSYWYRWHGVSKP